MVRCTRQGVMVRTLAGHGHWVNTLALSTDYVMRVGAYDPARGDVGHLADDAAGTASRGCRYVLVALREIAGQSGGGRVVCMIVFISICNVFVRGIMPAVRSVRAVMFVISFYVTSLYSVCVLVPVTSTYNQFVLVFFL